MAGPITPPARLTAGYFASSSGRSHYASAALPASSTDTVAGYPSPPPRGIAQSILSLRKSTVLSFSIHSTDSCGCKRCRNATSGASSRCYCQTRGAPALAERPTGRSSAIRRSSSSASQASTTLTGVTIHSRFAIVSELHRMGGAQDQLNPQQPFKGLQAAADGRLGSVHLPCGGGERSGLTMRI